MFTAQPLNGAALAHKFHRLAVPVLKFVLKVDNQVVQLAM